VLHGPAGRPGQLQSSTNNETWRFEDVRTFSFAGGEINFLDTSTTNGIGKYYRGVLQQ